jgi:hypothetical protein
MLLAIAIFMKLKRMKRLLAEIVVSFVGTGEVAARESIKIIVIATVVGILLSTRAIKLI